MKYLLSVDGGGTKTEFCVSNLTGEQRKSYITGSTNFKSVGEEEGFQNLLNGMKWITEELQIPLSQIAFAVLGISGCDSPNDYKKLYGQIQKAGLQKTQFYLCNDGVLGYYAQAYEPGIVVISGTGSIVMGITSDGRIQRAGGWGYNISDVGSGQWIGNEAIKETLLYCDGCREFSKLYEAVGMFFQSKRKQEDCLKDFPYVVTEIQDYNKIAGSATVVLHMAEMGNREALEILQRGAEGLAELSQSIYQKCEFHQDMPLHFVFSGGVMQSVLYQELLKAQLQKKLPMDGITCVVQKKKPVFGGIKLAMKMVEDKQL
ncbi:MAG: BadF/BadG/BcrA/BcrD ATPase family protein [Lachnospiraceae bacterium]|nr:BadF/BadG/BcrA/BcrD ATPase family protein [Lachnospiraceae bacterium]